VFNTLIEAPPIAAEILDNPDDTRRQHVGALGQDVRELLPQKAKPLAYWNTVLQKKAADLIDHSGPLADQARSHAVQGLQIQLIVGLYRNATGRWPLHSFRDRVRVPEIVLVTLPERPGINRRHLLDVMTERDQFSSYAMRRHAGLNTD